MDSSVVSLSTIEDDKFLLPKTFMKVDQECRTRLASQMEATKVRGFEAPIWV